MQEPITSAEAIVKTIVPALKTFPTNEIAIIGCHAGTMARTSCEYDLLVISRDPIPEKVVEVGGTFTRLLFRNEFEVREPSPELAVTMASAVPLRDNSLLLAAAVSDCRRNFSANCAALTESHLASSLKAVSRVDELLASEEVREADFWLLSAAREFAYAMLLSSEVVPSPSHALAQMKALSARHGSEFRAWADSSGLELASKASCENRLEGLSIVYDVLATGSSGIGFLPETRRYQETEAFALVKLKAGELLGSMQSVECYSYLGWEVVRSVLDLYSLHAARLSIPKDYSSTIRELTLGQDRLISEEVLRSLGFVRSLEMLRNASGELKNSIAALAKKS